MKSRLLLDTHVFLWWQTASAQLTSQAEKAIATADIVCVSAASAWEVSIKESLGKLKLQADFEEGVESSGFEKLAIRFAHARRAGALPAHHRDPFDRMLIAQSLEEGLTLVTRDRRLEPYTATFLWV